MWWYVNKTLIPQLESRGYVIEKNYRTYKEEREAQGMWVFDAVYSPEAENALDNLEKRELILKSVEMGFGHEQTWTLLGLTSETSDEIRKWKEKLPRSTYFYAYLDGFEKFVAGEYQAAIKSFDKAGRMAPFEEVYSLRGLYRSYIMLGNISVFQEKYSEAAVFYQTAEEICLKTVKITKNEEFDVNNLELIRSELEKLK